MINVLANRAADNFRLMRSGKITLSADETYAAVKVPKKAFVVGVWLEVLTAFDAVDELETDGSLTVGFTGNSEVADPDYFMADAVAIPTATGMKEVTKGKWFGDASGLITLTSVANDAAVAPVVRVWVLYSVIH